MPYIAALIISVASFVGLYNYLPLDLVTFNEGQPFFGATVTTIAGTDTLSASRSVINTNFTNLNNSKIENSTTSVAAITTLSNLASIGTITSGTWNGTGIGVAYGGTGSTTLASNHVMLGNTTSGLKTVGGLGTSGQFLTSNGAGAAPSWQSASVDQSATYAWTGAHLWSGAASSTLFGSLNGLYVGRTASTTILGNAATSTFSSNISVPGMASTTNLRVDTHCVGCVASSTYATATAGLGTNNGDKTTATAACPTGYTVTGGGASHANANAQHLNESYPAPANSWTARVQCNTGGGVCGSGTLTVYAMCVRQ